MSNFMQAAALIITGGVVGVGGFMFIAPQAPVGVASTAAVEAPVVPAAAATVLTAPAAKAEVLSVRFATTGSVESDAPDAAFAVFNVSTATDVADVTLTVSGNSDARVDEAVGLPWSKNGSSLSVDIGEMSANEERSVVVAFTLRSDSARFQTQTAFRDLHTGEMERVLSQSKGHSISRKMQVRDVYETVRIAYSDQAMEHASALLDDKEYAEALTWVHDAYARNVEVGMTLRLTGDLAGAQFELSGMEDELKRLSKPKPKATPRKPKGPVIDWVFGDRASPSSS